jgi:hypothetical protein
MDFILWGEGVLWKGGRAEGEKLTEKRGRRKDK